MNWLGHQSTKRSTSEWIYRGMDKTNNFFFVFTVTVARFMKFNTTKSLKSSDWLKLGWMTSVLQSKTSSSTYWFKSSFNRYYLGYLTVSVWVNIRKGKKTVFDVTWGRDLDFHFHLGLLNLAFPSEKNSVWTQGRRYRELACSASYKLVQQVIPRVILNHDLCLVLKY